MFIAKCLDFFFNLFLFFVLKNFVLKNGPKNGLFSIFQKNTIFELYFQVIWLHFLIGWGEPYMIQLPELLSLKKSLFKPVREIIKYICSNLFDGFQSLQIFFIFGEQKKFWWNWFFFGKFRKVGKNFRRKMWQNLPYLSKNQNYELS